jgi:hypothetical protein
VACTLQRRDGEDVLVLAVHDAEGVAAIHEGGLNRFLVDLTIRDWVGLANLDRGGRKGAHGPS